MRTRRSRFIDRVTSMRWLRPFCPWLERVVRISMDTFRLLMEVEYL
jgi:hypothetical protein